MKCRSSVHLYLSALLTMLFCQPAFPASAITTLPASGTWAGGTLENDIEVAVTSGPKVTGTIVIPSGKTLTLSIASSVTADHVTLSVPADFSGNCIFKVESGGTLKISGASYDKYFGIRGGTGNLVPVDKNGARISDNDKDIKLWDLTNPNNYTFPDLTNGAICTSGTVDLKYVRIYDVMSSSNGAIFIPQDDYKVHGKTTLTGCWIHRCKSVRGVALMVESQVSLNNDGTVANGAPNTAESCAVSMDNVWIFQCHVTGDGAGQSGCIRTYGNCVSNINLKSVHICQNKSDGDGCAAYWNGHGRPDTKMTFDGCKIYNNHSAQDGGALHLEGSFRFINNVTEIYDNSAGIEGGAIYIKLYASDTAQARADLKMDFNRYVHIHDNEAKSNGGGVAVVLTSTSMPEGSTLSVIVDGADISNNNTSGNGGGLYLWNAIPASNSIAVSLTVLGGSIIKNNTASNLGGGICCRKQQGAGYDDVEVTFTSGEISDNKAQNAGGVYLDGVGVTCGGVHFKTNTASSNGGGAYVTSGEVIMSDGSFVSNKCNGYGGGLYSNGSKIEIENGSFQSNWAALTEADLVLVNRDGGAIYHKSSAVESGSNYSMILRGGVFKDNRGDRGGAIRIDYANVLFDRLNGAEVEMSENWADNTGACIAIYNGGSMTVNGGKFMSNVSANTAGVIHINSSGGSVTMNDGLFDGNSAENFGGVINMTAGTLTINGGTYTNNKCVSTGSGKGGGGAIYLQYPAVCSIIGGAFQSNTVSNYGGAMYFAGAQCSISGGSIIGNSAAVAGGGIALGVYEDTDNSKTYDDGNLTIQGGVIQDNVAKKGGGFFVESATVTMSEGTITDNEAINGGGLFITGGTAMTFSDGFIANNKALVNLTPDGTNTMGTTTAYAPAESIYGVGGGVFLGAGTSGKVTTLTFGASGEEGNFGLYNNIAETAADDIYAYGQYTSITLPDISKMSLKGYNSKTSELYWVEDFMTGDTAYHDYGTNINTSGSYSPIRYRQAITAQKTVYKVLTTDPITKYVALSLGHEIIFITLQKTGLRAGESAIFRIFRVENDERTIYSEVLLVGVEGLSTVSKRVALYSGTWQVTEVPWAWSYDSEPVSYIRPIVGETEESDKIFVFTGVKKAAPPLHAEDIVVNDFGKGSAVTGSKVNTGTISDLDQTQDYQLK